MQFANFFNNLKLVKFEFSVYRRQTSWSSDCRIHRNSQRARSAATTGNRRPATV